VHVGETAPMADGTEADVPHSHRTGGARRAERLLGVEPHALGDHIRLDAPGDDELAHLSLEAHAARLAQDNAGARARPPQRDAEA
jgi:hypothetical protein